MPDLHSSPSPVVGAGLHSTSVRRGTFPCPYCKTQTAYRLISVHRTVRVVGFDVLPVRKAGEYVECLGCDGTFIPEVLEPDARVWNLRPLYLQAVLRVMALMMIADGVSDEKEIDRIIEVYQHLGGERLHRSAVISQAEHARADRRDVETYLSEIAVRLNEVGKLKVFQGAYEVAAADGSFQEEERVLLTRIARALSPRTDPFAALGVSLPQA